MSMLDLTILYYSSGRMAPQMAENFRIRLQTVVEYTTPIVSVTQEPVNLGQNICVGDIGQSYYNLFKQQLIGLREVKTKWVAMAEDDTLYTASHFAHRPSSEQVIAYQRNMYFLDSRTFWTKKHAGMFGCIAPTAYILDILERRYARFPEEILPRHSQKWFWMDPGHDHRLGFEPANTEVFETDPPLITLAYYGATYGKPKRRSKTSHEVDELPYWGNALELRNKMEGKT
jgi:hypothetical protein